MKKRFFATFGAATVALIVMLYLVLSATLVVGQLPVLGVGGVFLVADDFAGSNALVYPVEGDIEGTEAFADSTACERRPMLALQLDQAEVNGFEIYKDIEIPFYQDRWMSIQIVEPAGAIEAQEATIFVTQLALDNISIDNVEVTEGGAFDSNGNYIDVDNRGPSDRSTDIFGPNSGEFLLLGDPTGDATGLDLQAFGAKAWLHALTGSDARFIADTSDPSALIDIQIDYVNTTDIQNRYDNKGIDPRDANAYDREGYFDCLPASGDIIE